MDGGFIRMVYEAALIRPNRFTVLAQPAVDRRELVGAVCGEIEARFFVTGRSFGS